MKNCKPYNWNDVDEYPSFKTCESLSSKQKQKQYFEILLITHINKKIINKIIEVTENHEDKIAIKLQTS